MNKLIVTLAPTGNVPTKELTPFASLTKEEIVDDIEKAVSLGVSIAHIHVRDENLKPTSDRAIFQTVLDEIEKRNINVITQLSTGARGGVNTADYRGQMLDLKCEMASLSTGSSNFATSVNANSFELINALAEKMNKNNIKPEIEVFDFSMISNAVFLKKKGVLKGNLHFNLVMNVPGSLKASPKNLIMLVDSLPEDSTWTVSGIGSSHLQMLTMAIAMGGNVRTGLEDVTKIKGELISNVSLVETILGIAKAYGREIASVDEARQILGIL